ncbi:hypothetical protein H310_12521 [Aphanomyces invadans]|uniref:Uncharacterized protein n=1 Tax=Aphanomyces invadans TaxID=157072 RepID=A0A024TH44_9STRA|nr:hypothetical protein H310_12521 [Aphanomyces invadans]ETV93470.1 hypothetical protein H310_12521 [Aphanomyces invadans]|eukprot:XP_008877812.1 hypothetical protein H310_12521 [Aphanomyces invadans]
MSMSLFSSVMQLQALSKLGVAFTDLDGPIPVAPAELDNSVLLSRAAWVAQGFVPLQVLQYTIKTTWLGTVLPTKTSLTPRGRPVRREVANPFRFPGRRAPLSADAWFRQGEGYPISPAPYGGPPLPAERPEEAFAMGADQAKSTRAAGAAAANEAAQDSPMEDVNMGDDDGFVRQDWNAPAIPQTPLFEGSMKAEWRAFMREYQKYLAQINALQCVGSRPCMDPFSKRRITLFDMNKDHNDVTEAKWCHTFRHEGPRRGVACRPYA